MDHRKTFRPKLRQLKEQCVSCPFRVGNDEAFAEVVKKLAAVEGLELKGKRLMRQAFSARMQVLHETQVRGDFACHHTAYDADMKLRPESERRQCPGATAAYVEGGLK